MAFFDFVDRVEVNIFLKWPLFDNQVAFGDDIIGSEPNPINHMHKIKMIELTITMPIQSPSIMSRYNNTEINSGILIKNIIST